jgi:hypothetical protein
MMEGFFLDGIDTKAAGTSIGRQNDLIVLPGSDKTHSALAFLKPAESGAQVTLDPTVFKLMPIFCWKPWTQHLGIH